MRGGLLPRADGKGRVVAVEMMVATKMVRECIKDPERAGQLTGVIETGADQYGMQSFDQHLTKLYQSKQITLEEAKAAASNPDDFERSLNYGDGAADVDLAGESGSVLELDEVHSA